jgi:hypothetical protein
MTGSEDHGKPPQPAQLATLERDGWELDSSVARHKESPDTFWIPTAKARSSIVPTDFVKLIFLVTQQDEEQGEVVVGERLWVKVEGSSGPYFWGTLANDTSFDGSSIGLMFGAALVFLPEHIVAIMNADEQQKQERAADARAKKRRT